MIPGPLTNLVIEDSLLQIFEELGNLFVVSNMIRVLPGLRILSQRTQLSFNAFECAGRSSTPSPKKGQ